MTKASCPPAPLLGLPSELVSSICHLLPNSDIKNLRLTCRLFANKAQLRLGRVFISPSLRNLNALRGIADHDTFRKDVEEIIWDDATLKPIQKEKGPTSHGWDPDAEDSDEEEEAELQWFVRLCKISITHLKQRMVRQNRPDTVARQEELNNSMSFKESLKHYRVLELQQQYILQIRADEHYFRYALQRFPRLKRITVTPGAHGFLFEPLYKTPMIRNLPYGFLYPIPRGWPVPRDGINRDPVSSWDGDGAIEKEKNQWRGFRIVTRILAGVQHHVSELVFDNHKIMTGINHFAFHPPSEEYHNFCTILKRPGFRRVEVSLLLGYLVDEEADAWDTYRNGDLYKALAGAPDLEHVGLQSDYDQNGYRSMDEFVSLFSVFPLDHWKKLRHFGLSRMQETQDDLVSFLGKLPSTLESVELSFLAFFKEQGNYGGLLGDIRDKLGWRDRPVDGRVKICVLITYDQANREGRYIRLDKEVQDYVYGSGHPPFCPSGYISYGTGVQQDEFNPHWERPYEKSSTLKRLGY